MTHWSSLSFSPTPVEAQRELDLTDSVHVLKEVTRCYDRVVQTYWNVHESLSRSLTFESKSTVHYSSAASTPIPAAFRLQTSAASQDCDKADYKRRHSGPPCAKHILSAMSSHRHLFKRRSCELRALQRQRLRHEGFAALHHGRCYSQNLYNDASQMGVSELKNRLLKEASTMASSEEGRPEDHLPHQEFTAASQPRIDSILETLLLQNNGHLDAECDSCDGEDFKDESTSFDSDDDSPLSQQPRMGMLVHDVPNSRSKRYRDDAHHALVPVRSTLFRRDSGSAKNSDQTQKALRIASQTPINMTMFQNNSKALCGLAFTSLNVLRAMYVDMGAALWKKFADVHARKIQKAFRRYLQKVNKERKELVDRVLARRERAAKRIQLWWRRILLQEKLDTVRRVREVAATEIQRFYRGYRIRQYLNFKSTHWVVSWKWDSPGKIVELVGDFSIPAWTKRFLMTWSPMLHKYIVVLPKISGRHEVKFIVNGDYCCDGSLPLVADGVGDYNNVIEIEAISALSDVVSRKFPVKKSQSKSAAYTKFDALQKRLDNRISAIIAESGCQEGGGKVGSSGGESGSEDHKSS